MLQLSPNAPRPTKNTAHTTATIRLTPRKIAVSYKREDRHPHKADHQRASHRDHSTTEADTTTAQHTVHRAHPHNLQSETTDMHVFETKEEATETEADQGSAQAAGTLPHRIATTAATEANSIALTTIPAATLEEIARHTLFAYTQRSSEQMKTDSHLALTSKNSRFTQSRSDAPSQCTRRQAPDSSRTMERLIP